MSKNLDKLSKLVFLMAQNRLAKGEKDIANGMTKIAHMLNQFSKCKNRNYSKSLQLDDFIELLEKDLKRGQGQRVQNVEEFLKLKYYDVPKYFE